MKRSNTVDLSHDRVSLNLTDAVIPMFRAQSFDENCNFNAADAPQSSTIVFNDEVSLLNGDDYPKRKQIMRRSSTRTQLDKRSEPPMKGSDTLLQRRMTQKIGAHVLGNLPNLAPVDRNVKNIEIKMN